MLYYDSVYISYPEVEKRKSYTAFKQHSERELEVINVILHLM